SVPPALRVHCASRPRPDRVPLQSPLALPTASARSPRCPAPASACQCSCHCAAPAAPSRPCTLAKTSAASAFLPSPPCTPSPRTLALFGVSIKTGASPRRNYRFPFLFHCSRSSFAQEGGVSNDLQGVTFTRSLTPIDLPGEHGSSGAAAADGA